VTADVLKLFPDFKQPSWRPWVAFKGALDGHLLRGEALELFRRCTGRQTPPQEPVTECFCVIGRCGGKSRFAAALAIEAACLRDWTPYLAAGEWATAAIVAADRSQARNVFQYVEGFVDSCPPLAALVVGRGADAMEFANRSRVEVTTASSRTARGFTFCLVVADELAFWRSETTSEPDVEVLAAVRPGLATLPGARLVCISSPYARRGALWQAYSAHFGKEDSPILVWQAATAVMNPALPARVIEAAYEADPTSAAAEYGSQFRSDLAPFVTAELLAACVTAGVQGRAPMGDRYRYFGFADPSGGSSDSFTYAVSHCEDENGRLVTVLDCVGEYRPPFSAEETVRSIARALRTYRIESVQGDRYGGIFPRELFQKHGIVYEPATLTASDYYREALPLLTSGRAKLLDHSRMLLQWLGLERRTARGGRDTISHPPGGHDDLANSAAGALVTAANAARDDGEVLSANVADLPRQRVVDERELTLMQRDRDYGW
jgi:hypothetical protein